MRKIEKDLVAAIRACKSFKSGNTSFDFATREVKLYGNTIARIGNPVFSDNIGADFTLAGWNTVTTRSRINAMAAAFGLPGVCQRNGKPFVIGEEVGTRDWF